MFTMPIAVTTAFTSVGTCQDWDDYTICNVVIGGRTNTTYSVLTAYGGSASVLGGHYRLCG